MKGLFLKDSYIVIKQLIAFCLIIIGMLLFGKIADEGGEWICVVISYLTIICSSTACASLLADDEKNHFDIYSRVLPISRKNIINEKFILSLIINIVYLDFAAVAMGIGVSVSTTEFQEYMFLNIVLTIILSSLMLLLTIRFNAQKAVLIVVTIFPIIGVLIASLLGIYDEKYNLTTMLWKMRGLFVVLSLIIYALCFYFSSRIYEKKEIM